MIIGDPIYNIIDELKKYKETKEDMEWINDIIHIDKMIDKDTYDLLVVNQIYDKYKDELEYLSNLERNLRGFQINENNRSSNSNKQYLLNLRHSLVRVQILRIVKRKGKKMLEEDLINNNNNFLYNKFIKIMQ